MFNEVIDALPLPAMLVAADGRIEFSNTRARELFGNSIRGRHYITVLRQPAVLDAIEEALSEGRQAVANYMTTEARNEVTLKAT
mgnify:CR=1 FL=1